MEELARRYHLLPAAAFVRARLEGADRVSDDRAVAAGVAAGLPGLHRFKRSAGLPRVSRVLGILRGVDPGELLDVGSGRGVFLWPLVEALPQLEVTAIDILPHRLETIESARRGGLARLRPLRMDVTALGFADGAFDVVSALEVLEHLPDPGPAAREIVRVARRFAVISVPSRPDDNPGHVRLFDQRGLDALFRSAGAAEIRCEHVLNHLIALVKVS